LAYVFIQLILLLLRLYRLITACADPRFLIAVDVPSRWKRAVLTDEKRAYAKRHIALIDDEKTRKFMEEIAEPVSRLDGDSIPISKVSS